MQIPPSAKATLTEKAASDRLLVSTTNSCADKKWNHNKQYAFFS